MTATAQRRVYLQRYHAERNQLLRLRGLCVVCRFKSEAAVCQKCKPDRDYDHEWQLRKAKREQRQVCHDSGRSNEICVGR